MKYRGDLNMTEALVEILLVEDSTPDVTLFHEGLKRWVRCINLCIAEDGERALTLLKDGLKPSIIVLDINLPKINGYEVLRQLKNSPMRDIPVIIFSSVSERGDPPHADAYIQKPLYLEEYVDAVCTICSKWLAGLPDRQG